MKKVALLTVLLVVAASAAITFPSGEPSKVGVQVDVTITGSGEAFLYVISEGNQQWVYPTRVNLPYNNKIEITRPGNGFRLLARGAQDDTSEAFDVVVGDPNRWQILAPGEVPDSGLATSTIGKHGSAAVTAGDPENYTISICDKWWNPVTGSQTPSLETTDPFGHLPATPVVGGNSIELRTAGSRYVKVYGGGLTLADSSKVTVNPGEATQLLLICPDQEPLQGDDSTTTQKSYPGTKGSPQKATVGSSYAVKIRAVDKCWNLVSTYGPYAVDVFDAAKNNLTATTADTIKQGKNDNVNVKFTTPSPGTDIYAEDGNGKKTAYNTNVEVLRGIDSLVVSLNPAIVPKDVHSILHIEAYQSGVKVVLGEAYVELISGPKESFHIKDSTDVVEDKWRLRILDGVAETEVWAEAETTYTIRVTAGEQTKDLTLTIKELTELLVAPNPFKYGSPGHDAIKFIYKVAQAGAAEVLLLIADPYGNIAYKATYTSGEVVSPGQQEISWDGTNSKGNKIASGMYQAVVKVTLTNLSTEVLKKNFMVIW